MVDKLRGSTTISTEIRSYQTDAISRKSLARATVAARSSKIEQRDVEVTQTQPHIITRHSNKFLQISTTFPVMATFIPGVPEVDVPDVPNTTYTTGVLYVEAKLEAGAPISVSLYDPDIMGKTTQVTVFNATTGETEFLTLTRLDNDLFRGSMPTFLCRYKGEDFDGFLNLQPTDTIKIIYRDGRLSDGEPGTVTHVAQVISSVPVPLMFVRRAAGRDTAVGITLKALPDGAIPRVRVHDVQTATVRDILLTYWAAGEYYGTLVPTDLSPNIKIGDVLVFEYEYQDIFGVSVTATERCVIGTGETEGLLSAPTSVARGSELVIQLDDPDVDTDFIDVVVSGNTTDKFVRLRLMRVAIGSGLYRYADVLPSLFDNDHAITVTYADTSAGTPKLIQRITAITDIAAPPVTGPVVVPDTPTNEVEQLALQMEINGLFVLNGRFSGIIKLRAVNNETVRCSITQAS